jgi:D-alanyl-lipoteichoic acid acyltransferase DltB (MBOAT superfamily)
MSKTVMTVAKNIEDYVYVPVSCPRFSLQNFTLVVMRNMGCWCVHGMLVRYALVTMCCDEPLKTIYE